MSRFAFLFFLSSATLVVVAGVEACTSGDPDAGDSADAAAENARDTSYAFEEAEALCDPDADILNEVQDASIGDGASTTGICVACMRKTCATPLADCARDCLCQGIMRDAIGCYLETQNIVCLGKLTSYLLTNATRSKALAVAGCAQAGCPTECAVDAGPDSSTPFDAGSDAEPDAGTADANDDGG